MPTTKPPAPPSEPISLAAAIKGNPIAQKGGLSGAQVQAKPGILEKQSSFLTTKNEQQNKQPIVLVEEKKTEEKKEVKLLTPTELGFFTYSSLKGGTFPPELDKSVREQYLSQEDFSKLFNMPKESFAKLPAWKQKKMKQNLGLF